MVKIGFCNEQSEYNAAPRKSVIQVQFPGYGKSWAYYNDRFDLRVGDLVYVDGKLEGILGRVVGVNYNFKIKLSEYKRVIALVDTEVHGVFFTAGSYFITFDRTAIPVKKVRTWFSAPVSDEEEYASGNDDTAFSLENLNEMKVSPQIAIRGHEYYEDHCVKYLSVDGTRGYAIVQSSEPYEVEFEYRNGMVSNLICSCFCSYNCKHEFATMLQLKETLELIGKHYAEKYKDYFAVVLKNTLFSVAVDGKENCSIAL